MADPLTTIELNHAAAAGCQVPGCTHARHGNLFLTSRCHKKGTDVSYQFATGVLKIVCRECQKLIVEIAVDDGRGPTGEFPVSGQAGDEGGLNAALSIHGDLLRVDFATSCKFVIMRKQEAVEFANGLLAAAGQLHGG